MIHFQAPVLLTWGRFRAHWPVAMLVCIALAGLGLAAMLGFMLATPLLNIDDLALARAVPPAAARFGIWDIWWTTLRNADIGILEIRTYGLARTIGVAAAVVFGKAPAPYFAAMSLLHFASAIIVWHLFRYLADDVLIAGFAALAWAASPAVLPAGVPLSSVYPGLVSPYANGLTNPFRSAVLMQEALDLHAQVIVGTGCRTLADGRIAVDYYGNARGIFSADRAKIIGFKEKTAATAEALDAAKACPP